MWLKLLLWLGTKKGKWVLRIFVFLIAAVVQYSYTAYAEKRAYNNGYLVAKAEYAEAAKTQSANPNDNRVFARGYNGKAYERYEYHIKLAKAKALKEIL